MIRLEKVGFRETCGVMADVPVEMQRPAQSIFPDVLVTKQPQTNPVQSQLTKLRAVSSSGERDKQDTLLFLQKPLSLPDSQSCHLCSGCYIP